MKWFGGISYFKETPISKALLLWALSYYAALSGATVGSALTILNQRLSKPSLLSMKKSE
jgi:hypothetical protein